MESENVATIIKYVSWIIIIGLIIAVYFSFRDSAAGQALGTIFGDINGVLNWLNSEIASCTKDGLTSKSCSIGPWIIGGLVIAGILGILKFASILKPLLPESIRLQEEIMGREFTTEELNQVRDLARQDAADLFANDGEALKGKLKTEYQDAVSSGDQTKIERLQNISESVLYNKHLTDIYKSVANTNNPSKAAQNEKTVDANTAANKQTIIDNGTDDPDEQEALEDAF